MQNKPKIFNAVIWDSSPDKPGKRVSILAENLNEAKIQLKEKYGESEVYNIYNDEDSDGLR